MWTTIWGLLTVLCAAIALSGVAGSWGAFFIVMAFVLASIFVFALAGALGHRHAEQEAGSAHRHEERDRPPH